MRTYDQFFPNPCVVPEIQAGIAGHGGQGGQHVVGFEPVGIHHPESQGADQLADQVELLVERVLLLLTVGLVRRKPFMAERAAGPVEGHGHPGGLVVAQQGDEHLGEAEDGVGLLAGPGDHVPRDGEERPVGQRVAVDEEEPGHRGDPNPRRRQPR